MLIVLFENIGTGFDSLSWPYRILVFAPLIICWVLFVIGLGASLLKRPMRPSKSFAPVEESFGMVSFVEGGEILNELAQEEATGVYNFPKDET